MCMEVCPDHSCILQILLPAFRPWSTDFKTSTQIFPKVTGKLDSHMRNFLQQSCPSGLNIASPEFWGIGACCCLRAPFGDKLGESLGGSQAPPRFWKFPGLPRKYPRRLPRKFSQCGFQEHSRGSPEVSRTSLAVPPDFPGSSRTSPEVSPCPWEA